MGEKITLSLVQTSQDRGLELKRFVDSFNRQTNIDFKEIQLIFYDQGDNRGIFDSLNQQVKFDYIKGNRCSLSKARNLCLPYVKGKFIAFPDDDCWYEPDTLSKALEYLLKNKYQGVTGKGTNENGELTSKFPRRAAVLTKGKLCAAISYTMFFLYNASVKFDENIGVGSPFGIGSGEETDYLLNLMEKYNYKVYYDPNITIHHPTNSIYEWQQIKKRTYLYARGGGYLMQKHSFPLSYVFLQFFRPFCGLILNSLKLNFRASKRSYLNLKGRIEGICWKQK